MAAASVSTDGFGRGLAHHHKITKSRNRTVVKPILKKLHSAGSEKDSLDLDRGWEEQPIQYFDLAADDSNAHYPPTTRSARDVNFSISASALSPTAPSPGNLEGMGKRPKCGSAEKFSHARSASGASHASVATNGSGRNGTFVHPFQQTPRTSTPPLSQSYNPATSRLSLDQNYGLGLRDYEYSPTITEDNDDTDGVPYTPVTATPPTTTPTTASFPAGSSRKQQGLHLGVGSVSNGSAPAGRAPHHRHNRSSSNGGRRPSLASRRTSSLSDVTSPQSGPRSTPSNIPNAGYTPRIPAVVSHSRPELYDGSLASGLESSSPASTVPTIHKDGNASSSPLTLSTVCSSPLTNGTPVMSPLRSSLDMGGFRLRSRSSLDTATRQEQVRQARRKFEEKEKAKEEKYARVETRKRERADTKEAERQLRKGSSGALASGRTSSSTEIRPTASRKSTGTAGTTIGEKDHDLVIQGYDSAPTGQQPQGKADEVLFAPAPRRSKTAKRKTTGAWTSFVLWLRTRLLKLGRR